MEECGKLSLGQAECGVSPEISTVEGVLTFHTGTIDEEA